MMNKENLKREDKIIKVEDLDRLLDEKLSKIGTSIIKREHIERNENLLNRSSRLKLKPDIYKREILNLDENIEILIDIFEDDLTAEAAIKSLKNSPYEIQVIAQIIIKLYEKIDEICG